MARFTTQRRNRQLTPSRKRANYLARQERDFLAQLVTLRKEAGLTQQGVAEKLGVSQQAISKFESLESSPTLSTALSYAHAIEALVHFEVALDQGRFELYGEDWVSVEVQQDEPQTASTESELAERSLGISPERSLSTNNAEVFANLLQNNLALAARKQSPVEEFTEVQNQWIQEVADKAKPRLAALPRYDESALRSIAKLISSKTANPENFRDLPRLLSEAGVCLVYAENPSGSRISGISFQMDSTPVIGLSGLGKRLDKILFTLMHEIAHVLNGDVSLETKPLIHEEGASLEHIIEEREKKADELAQELIFRGQNVPHPHDPSTVDYSWVQEQAELLSVNYIVVVGHLQHNGVIEWWHLSKDPPHVIEYMRLWE